MQVAGSSKSEDINHNNRQDHCADRYHAIVRSLVVDDGIDSLHHLPLEHALKVVSKNISRFQDLICHWKSIHNSLVPIGRLSPELLLHIFEYVQNDYGLNNDVLTYMHQLPSLRLAQTCHSWRSLVYNCPSMWSKIVFSSEQQVKEMLKMAQDSMLSITMSQQYSFSFRPWKRVSSGFLDELLDMTRMRQLELQLRASDLLKILDHLSGEHAYGLSLLYIHQHTDLSSARRPSLTIPSRIFATPMPNLQYLDLSDCTVLWHSWDMDTCGKWTQLKELKLVRVSRPPERRFYGLLSRMKNLEHLLLDTTLPSSGEIPSFGSATNNSSSRLPFVELPRLSSLIVKGSTIADMSVFQAHVSYPKAHAQLHLHLDADHQSMEQPSIINSLFQSCCMTKSSRTPRFHTNLLLSASSDRVFSMALFDGQYYAQHHISSDDTDSVISEAFFSSIHYQEAPIVITLKRMDPGRTQILPMLSNLLSMTAVEICDIIDDHTQDEWTSFFSSQDEVKHLYVGSPTAQKIFTALSANTMIITTSTEVEDDQGRLLPLPRLTSLTLDGWGEDMPHDKWNLELLELQICLQSRQLHSAPIKRLNILHCDTMTKVILCTLKGLVVEVEWDDEPLEYFPPLRQSKRSARTLSESDRSGGYNMQADPVLPNEVSDADSDANWRAALGSDYSESEAVSSEWDSNNSDSDSSFM